MHPLPTTTTTKNKNKKQTPGDIVYEVELI